MQITISGKLMTLLHEKAIFRPDTKQLIVADLHLGKATHFRKAGINLPQHTNNEDLIKLKKLIVTYHPEEVIFLGDLFHSAHNKEWKEVEDFLVSMAHIRFILVKGNHDVLEKMNYKKSNFKVVDFWEDETFIYSHHPMIHEKFVLCGHIHPGIKINGKARQKIHLACFHVSENQLTLPAFGKLTGLFILEKKKQENYYVIYNSSIAEVTSLTRS